MKRKVGSFFKIVGGIYLIYLGATMLTQMQGREGQGDTWHGVSPSLFIGVGVLYVVVYLWIFLKPIQLYTKTRVVIRKKIARKQAERIRIQEFIEEDSVEAAAESEPIREETMSEKIQHLRQQPHKGVIGGLATDLLELKPQGDGAEMDDVLNAASNEEVKDTDSKTKPKRKKNSNEKKEKKREAESKPSKKDDKIGEGKGIIKSTIDKIKDSIDTKDKAKSAKEKTKNTKDKTKSTKENAKDVKVSNDKAKDAKVETKNSKRKKNKAETKELEVKQVADEESEIDEMDTKEIKPIEM